ncbi:MAG: hypothetical protein KDI55_09485 [Anaerolineae bacterium]|nr:hypothetical protein [Anaerolineae bacterium]
MKKRTEQSVQPAAGPFNPSEVLASLPETLRYLPVGVTRRDRSTHYVDPCGVQSAADLPARLYLGDQDPGAFSLDATGWRIRYQNAEAETHVELEYESRRMTLMGSFVWRGIQGMTIFANGRDWKPFIRYMSMPVPEEWLSGLAADLESRCNLECTVCPSTPLLVAFPDGAMMALLFPVPAARLPDLTGCLDTIDADPTIATPITMTATLARVSGESLDAERLVYLAQILCFFRDLARIADHCQRLGFIGSAPAAGADNYPNELAWRAIVMPLGAAITAGRIEVHAPDRAQRVIYHDPFPADMTTRLDKIRDASRIETEERLKAAETFWSVSSGENNDRNA